MGIERRIPYYTYKVAQESGWTVERGQCIQQATASRELKRRQRCRRYWHNNISPGIRRKPVIGHWHTRTVTY
ncbi:hypothetical protein PAXRUDRAFT_824161 [Paxillus rubicundulus Ve08.2h10]|uniref:Unplaced genomic scaffold scaffold_81, whole genome shotgun sequence n=1 Tax=Paxillus rubicundulus Ve08.2h10 TaxID=930991 RepID=A0A0D0EBT8_9AGAM|nr:hypothetical protein PAXRUDRAFT_824161 [Paxillus rubicundulus Ve08.2h10]